LPALQSSSRGMPKGINNAAITRNSGAHNTLTRWSSVVHHAYGTPVCLWFSGRCARFISGDGWPLRHADWPRPQPDATGRRADLAADYHHRGSTRQKADAVDRRGSDDFCGRRFCAHQYITLLVITAIIGTISPSGNEVGPFLAIEQAALPQTTTDKQRTQVFAWYSLLGSVATGLGSLSAASWRRCSRMLDAHH